MQWKCWRAINTVAVLGLLTMAMSAAAASDWEEEQVNPSEVNLENGVPIFYAQGVPERVYQRQQDGVTIYYRKVRYDNQGLLLNSDSVPAASVATAPHASTTRGATPTRYLGGGLRGPDYYQSPYNRDARKRYSGPGYYGACDWRGCREVHYFVPVVPVVPLR